MAKITLYTRKMCGFCTAAKRLLQSKQISFQEFDATFDNKLRNEMIAKSNGRATFPQIFIDSYHVGGCDELFALESAGKLDPLIES